MTAAHADAAKLLAENVRLVEGLRLARARLRDLAAYSFGEEVSAALAASPQSVAASEVIEAAEEYADWRGPDGASSDTEHDKAMVWRTELRLRLLAAVDRLRALREGK